MCIFLIHFCFTFSGTLTHGKMSVINAFLSNKITNSNEILHWIASTEVNSSHPIAKAIVSYCSEKCNTSTFETVQDFENIAGYGVKCKIKNTKIEIGTLEWINPKTLDEEIIKSSNNMQDLGYIGMYNTKKNRFFPLFFFFCF